jgi:hypothetical protein
MKQIRVLVQAFKMNRRIARHIDEVHLRVLLSFSLS